MLSNISKAELAELAKKTRATASLPKESLKQKSITPAMITQPPTDQDEETTFRLVFKRKRKATTHSTKHSHSDGQTPHQEVIIIQKCEAERSRGKSPWDPNFHVPTHGKTSFLPSKDKTIVHD